MRHALPQVLPVAPEFPLRADQKLLVLVNKTDTAPDCPCPKARSAFSRNGDGIESLRRILRSFVDTEALYHGDAIVSNNRHYEALTAAGRCAPPGPSTGSTTAFRPTC